MFRGIILILPNLLYTSLTMRTHRLITLMAALSLLLSPAAFAHAFDPNYIISDAELTDAFAMDFSEIQAFLEEKGALGDMKLLDHEGKTRYAADIIWRAAQNHGINPKFLLVLLQKEQSLIEDDSPSQKQLDWAAGYAVCDTCSMDDPTIGRWRGFGKQVNSAAMQFTEGYLVDIEEYGKTAGRYGPGITVTISGETVTPENAATAAMYAYTPHIHGNELFTTIWNRWFGRDYPTGTLLQVPGEDGVWLMQGGKRRPITSASALHSRFNPDLIVPVSQAVLERYGVGAPISFPNYTLLKDESGNIYLLVDDALRQIDSMETFRSIGFSEDEIVDITNTEVMTYDQGAPITKVTLYPQGRLLRLSTTGTIYAIQDGYRKPVIDQTIQDALFPGATVFTATPAEVEQYKEANALKIPDGYLIKGESTPTVYVISDGARRAIPSESVFTSFGYKFSNVKVVSDDVIALHPLGAPLEMALEDENDLALN